MLQPMRLDIFLANLLFGLTLVTAFMALAHICGDYLCKKFDQDAVITIRMRALTMFACLLTSLFVFIEKLNKENGLRISETNEPKLGTFLVKSGDSESRPASEKYKQQIDNKNSVTLRNQPSAEALSEEKGLLSLFKRVTVQSFIVGSSSGLCRGWRKQAENLNFKIKSVSKVSMTMSETNIAMLCASDPGFLEQMRSISGYLKAGGGVLIVGSVAVAKDQEFLKELLQIDSWSRPKSEPPVNITFGGDFFSWGGMPSGLRFGLGSDWFEQKGALLAKTKPEYKLQIKTKFDGQTPLIFSNYGKGRLLWTSVPGHLSERLNLLYSPYWNLMSARLMANLAGLPLLGIESLPTSTNQLVLPIVHANFESQGAVTLGQIFHDLKIKASFNLSISDVDGLNKIGPQLVAFQQEINALDFYLKEDKKNDFFSQLAYFYNWREAKKRLSSENTATGADHCCNLGASIGPGTAPNTIAAAKTVGFDYAIGFPYRDWITPYRLATPSTKSVQDHLYFKTKLTQSTDVITVLPTFTDGDFSLESKTKQAIAAADIEKWLREQIEESSWMGGPSVVPMHTHILGIKESALNLEVVLKKLKKENVSFQAAGDYLTWWDAKSSLLWRIAAPSSKELVFELKNPNSRSVKNIRLKTRFNQWQPTNNAFTDNIVIAELKPQEVLRWKLTKR